MKITNKFGVPETLMALANRDFYSKGKAEYSVTEIISSPRIKASGQALARYGARRSRHALVAHGVSTPCGGGEGAD
jgi:hypothetical protein